MNTVQSADRTKNIGGEEILCYFVSWVNSCHLNSMNITKALMAKGLWDDVLLVFSTVSTGVVIVSPSFLRRKSHRKISVANMIELLLKSFFMYHWPIFEAWKVPKRPVEVSCEVTQHLMAY